LRKKNLKKIMQHRLSWWEKTILLRKFDFVVLGAGIIGKQIALRIAEKYPAARIAIVDRSPVPYGASTRNAGFACFGSVSEILDDFNRSPEHEVYALAAKRYKGIQMLLDDFGADAIGYRNTGSFEIFTDQKELDAAQNACQTLNEQLFKYAGIQNTFTSKPSENMGMKVLDTCLFNPYEGMINSGMLNEIISYKTHKAGVIPMYGLSIQNIENTGHSYVLRSEQGVDIEADQLIIANNAFAKPFLPNEDIEPARGQVIVTSEMEDLPFDGIFHHDKGYIYFRTLGKRILIGGARNLFYEQENTFDMSGSEALKTHLEDYLRTVVVPGRSFETEMHWSGIMAMGKEKLPIVKRIDNHLSICVRMSGMGVALGPVLSREVAELF
jgi:glycine/D-amino acid oxidase-like deaminating enzyme